MLQRGRRQYELTLEQFQFDGFWIIAMATWPVISTISPYLATFCWHNAKMKVSDP
jgi:hypothetical protein